jgi:dissimilatory sulfite reductase (desulfoviridin) alpha/beta subunit
MRWTREAEQAVSRVPFFVRKRVRKRVEEETARLGELEVTLEHVRACQKRFLERMDDEVKGYQVETCFGPNGCPNRALMDDDLAPKIEARLKKRDLRSFLKERVGGPLKLHHEFRISISDCPNGCSRPQIVDVGLIGARKPRVSTENACSQCEACVQVCRENAIALTEDGPVIHEDRCLSCGQCLAVCPTGTLEDGAKGYRVLVGGKLGRHPQLGKELCGLYAKDDALRVIDRCVDHFQAHCRAGERFGEIIERTGVEGIVGGESSD